MATAPAAWDDWAKWAEKRHPVTDAEGHGPDIGSDEWANALAKRIGIPGKQGDGPVVGSKEWRQAVEKKLQPVPQRELLSSHDTVARFAGMKEHRCLGLTSLCPERCGHSGKLATFEVVKYVRYEKPGEYGDPKQEVFQVLVEDNMKNVKVPEAIRDAIFALKAGDLVRLQWNHDYISQEGAKFPERPILRCAPIPREQADKLKAD